MRSKKIGFVLSDSFVCLASVQAASKNFFFILFANRQKRNELERSTVDLLVRSTDVRKKQFHLLLDWTL